VRAVLSLYGVAFDAPCATRQAALHPVPSATASATSTDPALPMDLVDSAERVPSLGASTPRGDPAPAAVAGRGGASAEGPLLSPAAIAELEPVLTGLLFEWMHVRSKFISSTIVERTAAFMGMLRDALCGLCSGARVAALSRIVALYFGLARKLGLSCHVIILTSQTSLQWFYSCSWHCPVAPPSSLMTSLSLLRACGHSPSWSARFLSSLSLLTDIRLRRTNFLG
jgi:hypothetical protein